MKLLSTALACVLACLTLRVWLLSLWRQHTPQVTPEPGQRPSAMSAGARGAQDLTKAHEAKFVVRKDEQLDVTCDCWTRPPDDARDLDPMEARLAERYSPECERKGKLFGRIFSFTRVYERPNDADCPFKATHDGECIKSEELDGCSKKRVLRPVLEWCDPANARSALCDGNKANLSYVRGVGYRGQSCADNQWLQQFIRTISFGMGGDDLTNWGDVFMASPPLAPWDQRAYDAALERGGELSEYRTLFDDLCADRGFCAANGYAPEDSLARVGSPRLESHVRSGRCWDVYEARDHWRGVDLAHAPTDLTAWWRCCCKVLEISYMQSYRDLDVPSVCQASPRSVATKAQDRLNGRLIKREISQAEYEILWNQIRSARRVGKIYT